MKKGNSKTDLKQVAFSKMKKRLVKSKSVVILFGGTYIIAHFIVFVNVIVFHFKNFSLYVKKGSVNLTKIEMKHELINLGRSQADLVREIESRYKEKMSPTELNAIMGGSQAGAKAERVKVEVEQIISDWKKGG